MAITTPVRSVKMIYEHDEIVIGSNLSALLYAFNNKLPVFYTEPQRPFRFDYIEPHTDVSCIGLPETSRTLHTHDAPINIGAPKELIWERLLFLISLAGRAPLSTLCTSLRHNGHSLICSNAYSKIAEVKFEKAYYFGDFNCTGIVDEKMVANPHYMCYDWIAFNRGGKHEVDFIETTDNFVKQIWFYPTDRVDGNSAVKDACLVSTLTHTELQHFDYSQTMARFKMIAEMRERGMRGPFNGYSPTGNPKYYNFRTSIIGRQTTKKSSRAHAAISTVEIACMQEEDLFQNLPEASMAYHRFLEAI